MSKKININVNASILVWAFDALIEKMNLLWLNNYNELKQKWYEVYTDVVSQNQNWEELNVCFDLTLVKKR